MKPYQNDYKTPLSDLGLPNRLELALARNQEGLAITPFFPGSEGKLFLLHTPDLIRNVLGRLHETFVEEKHPFAKLEGLYTDAGRGVLLLGARPAKSPIDFIAPVFREFLSEFSSSGNQAIDVFPLFSRLVLEVMGRALFGYSLGNLADRFFRASMRHEDSLAMGRGKGASGNEKERLRATIERELLEQEHIATTIMAARQAEGVPIPTLPPGIPIQRAIVRTLLNAYAGTATTLSWAALQLARHPEHQNRLQKSLSVASNEADLINCEPLTHFLYETLRLYPTAWMMSRRCLAKTQLGDVAIPAEASVLICTYTLHRDPRLWPNSESFLPERFAAGPFGDAPAYSFLPFGAGPHRCVAMKFAMDTLQVLLGLLIERFEFTEVPGLAIVPFPRVALQPEPGAWIKLKPR